MSQHVSRIMLTSFAWICLYCTAKLNTLLPNYFLLSLMSLSFSLCMALPLLVIDRKCLISEILKYFFKSISWSCYSSESIGICFPSTFLILRQSLHHILFFPFLYTLSNYHATQYFLFNNGRHHAYCTTLHILLALSGTLTNSLTRGVGTTFTGRTGRVCLLSPMDMPACLVRA